MSSEPTVYILTTDYNYEVSLCIPDGRCHINLQATLQTKSEATI